MEKPISSASTFLLEEENRPIPLQSTGRSLHVLAWHGILHPTLALMYHDVKMDVAPRPSQCKRVRCLGCLVIEIKLPSCRLPTLLEILAGS